MYSYYKELYKNIFVKFQLNVKPPQIKSSRAATGRHVFGLQILNLKLLLYSNLKVLMFLNYNIVNFTHGNWRLKDIR